MPNDNRAANRRRETGMDCQECGAHVEPAGAYHPYLYCELVKLGHRDPEAYLRSYGFERVLVKEVPCG